MNKPFCLLLLSCFVCFSSLSQKRKKVVITEGPILKMKSNEKVSEIVSQDSRGVQYLTSQSSSFILRPSKRRLNRLDNSLSPMSGSMLNLKKFKKNRYFKGMVELGGNLHMLTAFDNQLHNRSYLFHETISDQNLAQRDDMQMVLAADHVGNQFESEGEFEYVLSDDNMFMLLISSVNDKENRSRTISQCVLYSDSMTVLWKGELSLGETDTARLEVNEIAVSNDGRVILVASVDKKWKEWKSSPEYRILTYDVQGQLSTIESIESGERFFNEITVGYNDDGDLICAGLYSN